MQKAVIQSNCSDVIKVGTMPEIKELNETK